MAAGDGVRVPEGGSQPGAKVGDAHIVDGDGFDGAGAGAEPEERLGGVQVGQQDVAVREPVSVTDSGEPDDPQGAAGGGGHGDGVAERDVLGLGGGDVDDDLV